MATLQPTRPITIQEPMPSMLESDLQRLFIVYKPKHVLEAWNKTIQHFRDILQEYDTKPTPTIVLKNEIVEPLTAQKPLEQKSKIVFPDKEAQKEKLRLHREAIMKRRQELAAQGTIPETQLTEENLKKWIQQERKNYWTIAELTGCNDVDISNKAKSLGILSEIAMMIRKKRAK